MKNRKLAFFYFFSYVCIGCILSQLIPMLNQSFSIGMKTFILGISAILAFLLSLILGKYSDTCQKIKPSFLISMFLYLISVSFLFLSENKWIHTISFVSLIASSKTIMSSSETILLLEKKDEFGKYHCMGVIGLMIGSWSTNLFDGLYLWLFCILCGCLSIMLISNFKEITKDKKSISFKEMMSLLKNKQYLAIVFIFFFLMLMGFADQYVVVDKMVSLNASKLLISCKYALQALMEIPLYLMMNIIFKKFSISKLLIFCILMSALKFILYGFVSTPLLILFVTSLQIFTHPLIVLLSKRMILSCTPKHLVASSQIIGFAVYYGLSGFIASFIGVYLSNQFSYDIALYVFAFFSIFPLMIWHKCRNMLN